MTDPKQDHKSTRVDCNQPDSSQVLNCMPFTKPSAEGSPLAVIVDSIAMVEPCVARASGVVMAWLLQQVSVRLYIIHDDCTQGVGRWNPTDGNRYPRILNHATVRPKQPNLVVTLRPVGVYEELSPNPTYPWSGYDRHCSCFNALRYIISHRAQVCTALDG